MTVVVHKVLDPRELIINLVAAKLSKDLALITDSTTLAGDLGADSLDITDVEMAIEEQVTDSEGKPISLKGMEFTAKTTVGDLVNFCRKAVGYDESH